MSINPEVLCHVFQTGTAWQAVLGIPKNSIMKGFILDPATQMLNLFVENEAFDEIDVENEVAPSLETSFKQLQ